jgi:hypothetical protein
LYAFVGDNISIILGAVSKISVDTELQKMEANMMDKISLAFYNELKIFGKEKITQKSAHLMKEEV